jgi:hypothetical protein
VLPLPPRLFPGLYEGHEEEEEEEEDGRVYTC